MPKNKLSDLRNHLFETIEALKDDEAPMQLNRALAISDVAQTIINSAKLEIDLLRACPDIKDPSGFFSTVVDTVATQERKQIAGRDTQQ